MTETLREFQSYPSVELCYANIDSIHISIKKSELDGFLENHSDLISEKLGHLKVQAIADTGYWFDVGRYWLFKEGTVLQYKNRIFNHLASKNPFTRHRKINYIYRSGGFSFIKTPHLTIENSLAFNKKLEAKQDIDYVNYCRYDFLEVSDLNVAGDSSDEETFRSKKTKVDLFNRIATVQVPLRGESAWRARNIGSPKKPC